jgi:hypothetical protein
LFELGALWSVDGLDVYLDGLCRVGEAGHFMVQDFIALNTGVAQGSPAVYNGSVFGLHVGQHGVEGDDFQPRNGTRCKRAPAW